jgi:hypothetical protein
MPNVAKPSPKASRSSEVVEYALARTASPTLVAEYQTMLPTKALLRRKLHELYAHLAPRESSIAAITGAVHRRTGAGLDQKIRGRRRLPRREGDRR